MKYLTILCLTCLFASCKTASVKITDEYIEVVKPGQQFGIVELQVLNFDTTLNYPMKEKEISTFTLVERKTHEQINDNADVKVFFQKKNDKYCWAKQNESSLANLFYSDTIKLKPFTWYRVTTENYGFYSYFYWNGKKGDFAVRLKPKSGAW